MVKRELLLIFVLGFGLLLSACGGGMENSESSQDKAEYADDSAGEMADFDVELNSEESEQTDSESADDGEAFDSKKISDQMDRKVIYTADLQIEVKNYQKAINDIQTKVEKFKGYVVESNMYEDQSNGAKTGQITARIPQETFQEFIKLVEDGSSKVLESSTSGQDVTEEFIDLESRLKSKRVVEERLLSFMEDAKKTEDLLKISTDLAKVQEEIEEVTGRMKYLQNKSDLATVSIYIQEKNVELSGTGKDKLNTWEQTKQQFMKSINFLITAFSNLFVLLIGNLPILILIGIIGLALFLFIRKKLRKRKNVNNNRSN